MPQKVSFHVIDSMDVRLLDEAHRLLCQHRTPGQRFLVLLEIVEQMKEFSELIWQRSHQQFIPYGIEGEPSANDAQALLSTKNKRPNNYRNLLNLSSTMPASLNGLNHLIELVSFDETQKDSARERYKQYRQAGYAVEYQAVNQESAS